MNRIQITSIGVFAIAALLTLSGPLEAAPPRYIYQDLGAPPNCDISQAYGVNNIGQVVGFGLQEYPLPLYRRAFLKNFNQPMEDIGSIGGNNVFANAINNAGQVVGTSLDASGEDRAFLKTPGRPMEDRER